MRPRRGPSSRRRRRRFCCERGRRGFLERSRTQACDDPLGRRGGVQPADAGGLEGDLADVSRRPHGTKWGPARRRGQCRRRALGGRGADRTRAGSAGSGNGGGGRDGKAGRGRAPSRCCGKTAGRPQVAVGRGSRAASAPGRAPATGEGRAADPACITAVAAAGDASIHRRAASRFAAGGDRSRWCP